MLKIVLKSDLILQKEEMGEKLLTSITFSPHFPIHCFLLIVFVFFMFSFLKNNNNKNFCYGMFCWTNYD